MSDTSEPGPRRIRIGLVAMLLVLAVAGGIAWFFISQSGGGSAARELTASPSATSAPAPEPAESASPSASPSPTVRPLLTPEEALEANLGRGYELRTENGASASLCEANRFIAPYNIDAGKPSGEFYLDTTEGSIQVIPVTNDANGYSGVIVADC